MRRARPLPERHPSPVFDMTADPEGVPEGCRAMDQRTVLDPLVTT
ncbi:hypothetical protein ACFV83_19940 [Streptomyces pharetrae]